MMQGERIMCEEKTAAEILKEKLCMNPKNAALVMQDDEIIAAAAFLHCIYHENHRIDLI